MAWLLVCVSASEGHEPVPRPSIAGPLLRGAAPAVLAPRQRAVARPLMASRPPFHRPPPPMRTRHPCRGDGQHRRVAHAPVPRRGVRRGVLHLRVLLPGAGLLRGGLPRAPRDGTNGATPTGGTSRVWKAGSITVTTNGPTGHGAASGA